MTAKHRRYNRSTRYGLTDSTALELRDRPCDLCGVAPEESRGHHAIDHCHSTGRVRGTLCMTCNTAIGKFRDSPELLLRALWYLGRDADYRDVDRDDD